MADLYLILGPAPLRCLREVGAAQVEGLSSVAEAKVPAWAEMLGLAWADMAALAWARLEVAAS